MAISKTKAVTASNSRSFEDKKREILEVSVEIFSERGYRATGLRDIAERVGLRQPSLYYYFSSKELILIELYEQVMEDSIEAVSSVVEKGLEPEVAFREVLEERIRYMCQNKRLVRIFFEEEAELPPQLTKKLRRRQREYEDMYVSLLEEGRKKGRFKFNTTPRITVYTILGAVNWSYRWYNPGGSLSVEVLAREIADMLLKMIEARGKTK
jgi:TetR/AcrR family transcriptional regulator, cholesterol catabolism regulator